jgi:hypothetical protein
MMRDCNAIALTPARKSSNGVLLSRLLLPQKPIGQEIEGLFCLNTRLFPPVEASSIRSDLEQEYFCAFGVTRF